VITLYCVLGGKKIVGLFSDVSAAVFDKKNSVRAKMKNEIRELEETTAFLMVHSVSYREK
jgi:hypothetical protein